MCSSDLLSPYPAAWTELHRTDTDEVLRVKLFASILTEEVESIALENGSIITDNKSYINVVTANGLVSITDLQLSGKKRMNTIDFLNGYKLNESDYLK